MTVYLDTLDQTVIKCVQMATLENSAPRCAFPVPTTPRATTGTVTANVCPAGPLLTAPNHVILDVLVHSALRPVPVQPTCSVTDLLETVCVRAEEMTASKTHLCRQAVS